MQENEFLRLLEEEWQIAAGTLHGAQSLKSLDAWDSLGMVTFIALVDRHFQQALSVSRLVECESVSDLIALVHGKIAA